jgi:signal transduction histidine kinase
MSAKYKVRVRIALGILIGILLLNILTLALSLSNPSSARAHILLTICILTLAAGMACVVLLPRWLLSPYRRLVNEAEKAPVDTRKSPGGDETEFVLETFQAIVAQLQAQSRELEQLSAQASARAESAERFSERIIGSLPSGLVAFNSDGIASVLNSPATELLGIRKGRGESFRSLLKNAPDLSTMVERSLSTGEIFRREEVLATNEEGAEKRLGVTVAPIEPVNGRSTKGALCLLTDLTEVSKLREALALKRNLESLGEMSAGLAHEFKNSLATLQGYSQLIQRCDTDENARQAATSLVDEIRHLTDMVTGFLNFAKPEPPKLAVVSLNELLLECLEELRQFAEEHNVELKLEGEFPQIHADELLLRQAFINLIRNGCEAIQPHSSERWIRIVGQTENKLAVISFEDTGRGIPEADLQRVFLPFFTTKSHGHGIGLALTHRVITNHGGTLVASNSGYGAIFTVKLPMQTVQTTQEISAKIVSPATINKPGDIVSNQ